MATQIKVAQQVYGVITDGVETTVPLLRIYQPGVQFPNGGVTLGDGSQDDNTQFLTKQLVTLVESLSLAGDDVYSALSSGVVAVQSIDGNSVPTEFDTSNPAFAVYQAKDISGVQKFIWGYNSSINGGFILGAGGVAGGDTNFTLNAGYILPIALALTELKNSDSLLNRTWPIVNGSTFLGEPDFVPPLESENIFYTATSGVLMMSVCAIDSTPVTSGGNLDFWSCDLRVVYKEQAANDGQDFDILSAVKSNIVTTGGTAANCDFTVVKSAGVGTQLPSTDGFNKLYLQLTNGAAAGANTPFRWYAFGPNGPSLGFGVG